MSAFFKVFLDFKQLPVKCSIFFNTPDRSELPRLIEVGVVHRNEKKVGTPTFLLYDDEKAVLSDFFDDGQNILSVQIFIFNIVHALFDHIYPEAADLSLIC